MVAVVAGRGYAATRVEDLLEVAGVSRNAFYRQFSDKRDCFVATIDALADAGGRLTLRAYREHEGTWDERLRAALETVAELIVAQPAAAHLCFVDVHAAGPEGLAHVERVGDDVERAMRTTLRESPERAAMPRDVVRALLGGLRKMAHTRLRLGREHELVDLVPEVMDWILSYRSPPEPLARPQAPPGEWAVRAPAPRDPRERILRAVTDLVAEKGYPALVVSEIAERASVSLTTLYAHFESKEAAFLATLEDAQRRVLEATLPGFDADDWEHAISRAAHAFFGFLAANPEMATLGAVGVWATGPPAFELRAQGLDSFKGLLSEGYRKHPNAPSIAAEAIGETIDALLYHHVRRRGADRLYELPPTSTFLTLAPFVGAEAACAVANSYVRHPSVI
jgi:AcrR family transcriptional regulator